MKQNKYKFVFLRHANTAKAEKDLDRQLTAHGWLQINAMAEKLAGISFDLCLTSPAIRVLQTIGALQNQRPVDNLMPIQQVEELYLPDEGSEDRMALDAVFKRLGYAPLSDYMKETEFKNMTSHNDKVIDKVMEAVEGLDPNDDKDLNFLIGGHAIMINLLMHDMVAGYILDDAAIAQVQRMAADTVLGEAECFVLELEPMTGKFIGIEHLMPELDQAAA